MQRVVWLKMKALFLREGFACHQLGAMHATGDGVAMSHSEAVRWYRRGAKRGDAECQYDLGFMYLLGEGVVADTEVGLRWLRSAAELGELQAARLLSDLYGEGRYGVKTDESQAERWRKHADYLEHCH